jgi:hypothetical protein
LSTFAKGCLQAHAGQSFIADHVILGSQFVCIELVLLITIGAVRSRGLLGPGFYVAHVIFFFLCPPALANVLVLRPKTGVVSQWWVAGALCTVLAFCLVLLQYGVSEALYGIDGDNGPYGILYHLNYLSS